MAQEKVDIGQLIYDETEKRLNIMQQDDYIWPKKAGKWNWIVMIALMVVCITLIVLCMTGVIV